MLALEDEKILGLARARRRRTTAVSQVLRAITDDVLAGREAWPVCSAGENAPRFRILVAADRATRQRAYALAYRVYHRAGYTNGDAELCVAAYDTSEHTLTLLAEDMNGRECATISLVFDAGSQLPCDEIYHTEADALRSGGCKLAEVTRLAIDEQCPGARELLLHLFNQCYIFARLVRGRTDLLVEVNPRHVNYYQRLLHFQIAGPERPCSRVQGAPAVLLRLNLPAIEAAIKGTGCTGGRGLDGRRLHPYPYSKPEEEALAQFLTRRHRPMTIDDARYFGLVS
jgi:hypothetical protein